MKTFWWAALGVGLSGICLGAALDVGKDAANEQVIQVTAQRFTFTPNEIVVKKGRPVVLEFSSLDFVHGFNIPSLKLRADLPPGQITRVRFTPDRVGEHPFVCDNFCGEGHEDMHGRIVVKE
ncbi:MAG TPA: cupredoxin domain-containing protein [Thiobacillus sp.]|nr:cupredoxin domain-containing protein [Thiobacillus sp.]